MSNQVYLIYQNKDSKPAQFTFNTHIPFLWQELYDLKLIEAQEEKILKSLGSSGDSSESFLNIPIQTAIENLERKSKAFTSEKTQKKDLRIEFLNFLKENVLADTDLKINFSELKELYHEPQVLIDELKSFHTDRKKELRYQREKPSFRAIGHNEEFGAFSSVYQFFVEEDKVHNKINLERHQAILEKRNESKTEKNKLENLLLLMMPIGLFVGGFLFIVLRDEVRTGIFMFILGIATSYYCYWVRKKVNVNEN